MDSPIFEDGGASAMEVSGVILDLVLCVRNFVRVSIVPMDPFGG